MTRSRTVSTVLAAAGLACALAPAAAHAATTIGTTAAPATQNTTLCAVGTPCLLLSDAAVVGAPGVVTSWHLRSGSVGGAVRLRVLRPAAGGRFTSAGTGAPQTVTREDPYVNDFPERLPVRPGDVLALDNTSSALVLSEGAGHVRVIAGALADGATAAVTGTEPGARRVLLSADVEPDADGDGFGDETQDACPAAADRHVAPCTGAVADVVVDQQLDHYLTNGHRSADLVVTVHNTGPADATDIVVADHPGAGTTLLNPAAATTTIPALAAGATTTFHLSVGAATTGPSYPELTNTVSATADQGDPRAADNTLTRSFNVGPTLTKPSIDLKGWLRAGREDLLRQVRVGFTTSEATRVTMTLTSRATGAVRTHVFDAPGGYNAVGGLFRAGGPFAGLSAGVYTLRVRVTDRGLLQSVARKIPVKVLPATS